MTKEEAIIWLNTDDYESKGYNDAIAMAIKALEQRGCVWEIAYERGKVEVLNKIRAEIEDLTYYSWEVSPRTVIDDVLEIIDKYKESDKESRK